MTHEMNHVDFCKHCGAARQDLVEFGDFPCHPTVGGARFAAEREAWAGALVDQVMAAIAKDCKSV